MDSGTMNSTRAHQIRVLNGQFFFLIKIFMSLGQGGLKKHGTRAHQTRVPEIVVDSYIVRKQCFWAKYFQN